MQIRIEVKRIYEEIEKNIPVSLADSLSKAV
jgi:hypothetical protein